MDKTSRILGMLILLVGGVGIGTSLGIGSAQRHYRAAAVEHHCAAYDATTGEWGWLETRP